LSNRQVLLAIDVGTSRIKVAVFTANGKRMALESEPTRTIRPREVWAEQDPNIWWFTTARMIRGLMKLRVMRTARIAAIAVTGQMHGPVLLDKKGKPLGNCLVWQDRRAEKEVQEIAKKIPERRLYRLSGYRLSPYMSAPKLLWMKKSEHGRYAKTRWIVLPKDYVRSRLTGEFCTDWTDANGTGLFDLRRNEWAGEIFEEVGLDITKMPEIRAPFDVVGETNARASRETNLDRGIPVVAGGGDDVVAIGTGAVNADELVANLGTSCSTYVSTREPVLDSKMRLECFRGFEEGRWLLSGTTTSAASSVDWFLRNTTSYRVRIRSPNWYSFLDKLIGPIAKPSGVVFLPYLAGERSPIWNPKATGALLGLQLHHTTRDLVQGILEGVGFGIRSIVDVTEALGNRVVSVIVAGGPTSSKSWMQILANVLNKRVTVPREGEATVLGAAMLAAVGIKSVRNIAEAAARLQSFRSVFVPQSRSVRDHERSYSTFLKASKLHQRDSSSVLH
jgi:xylulokinase